MTKRLFLVAAFIIIALSLFLSPAFAAYSWVDDNGVFHITDYPKPVKREEPKESAPVPDKVVAPIPPEVKQSPAQTAPLAPTPPQGPITKATATAPSSAGTPTMRPAAPVSPLSPAPGVHGAVATAATATVSQLTTTATLTAVQEQPRTALPLPEELQQMTNEGVMAFVAAFFMIFLVLGAALYVYFSLCLFLIAKKLNVQAPWTAWIPLVNIWTLLQAAGKPCWWVLLFFIPFVSVIVIAYVWMCIVENLGRNKWLGLLMLVPIVNLVYIGVLAFSNQE